MRRAGRLIPIEIIVVKSRSTSIARPMSGAIASAARLMMLNTTVNFRANLTIELADPNVLSIASSICLPRIGLTIESIREARKLIVPPIRPYIGFKESIVLTTNETIKLFFSPLFIGFVAVSQNDGDKIGSGDSE